MYILLYCGSFRCLDQFGRPRHFDESHSCSWPAPNWKSQISAITAVPFRGDVYAYMSLYNR